MLKDNTLYVKHDSSLKNGLRKVYHEITDARNRDTSLKVSLTVEDWISAASLNMLLTFIEAVSYHNNNFRFYVDLISDSDLVRRVLDDKYDPSEEKVELLRTRLIFFEAMKFVEALESSGVVVLPAPRIYRILKEKIHAFKATPFFLYSSKILALSPLIQTEEDQHALTTRIETLNSILYKNLQGRIDIDYIKQSSNQIMFELVKNVYQHSKVDESAEPRTRSSGFACAEINKYPATRSKKLDLPIVYSIMEQLRPQKQNMVFRWLTISINDYGIGMIDPIKNDLTRKLMKYERLLVGNKIIDKDFLVQDDIEFVKLAVTTNYSTKILRHEIDMVEPDSNEGEETWKTADVTYKLAARGHGLVFCMCFIARCVGRLNIRTGTANVTFLPKPETPLSKDLSRIWNNVEEAASKVSRHFDDYFFIEGETIKEDASEFPGTQVTIEIPVEARFA